MPANDLALLVDAARAAGEIATPHWGQSPKTWEKDAGAGPVTEADIAVNDMLRDQLCAARPDYGWLSEETEDDADRLSRKHVFIIDPIDGTRSFIANEKTWAHSLAVARNGQVTAAVIFLPMLDKLYAANLGGGAWLNGVQIRHSGREQLDQAEILASRPVMQAQHWPGGVPPVTRHFRPSLAYRMALVAEGRFDAMITFRDTWEWDVAAGNLIATEAGALTSDRRGKPVLFNNPHPALNGMIAGTARVHHALYSRHNLGAGEPATGSQS